MPAIDAFASTASLAIVCCPAMRASRVAHSRVGPDLDHHHRGDEQYAEARGDAELGADRKI
jgi:hypothetical protein